MIGYYIGVGFGVCVILAGICWAVKSIKEFSALAKRIGCESAFMRLPVKYVLGITTLIVLLISFGLTFIVISFSKVFG
jgi:hypothetical protein